MSENIKLTTEQRKIADYVIEQIQNGDPGYKARAIINGGFYNLKRDVSRKIDRDEMANYGYGVKRYKDPVDTVAALPKTGNEEGDGRVVKNDLDPTGKYSYVHLWDGNKWSKTPLIILTSEVALSGGSTSTLKQVEVQGMSNGHFKSDSLLNKKRVMNNGDIEESNAIYSTDFIRVSSDFIYIEHLDAISDLNSISYFDKDKNYLKGIGLNEVVSKKIVRLAPDVEYIIIQQAEADKGSVSVYISNQRKEISLLINNTISNILLDKNSILKKGKIKGGTNVLTDFGVMTDLIPISEIGSGIYIYGVNDSHLIWFFDKDGKVLSGAIEGISVFKDTEYISHGFISLKDIPQDAVSFIIQTDSRFLDSFKIFKESEPYYFDVSTLTINDGQYYDTNGVLKTLSTEGIIIRSPFIDIDTLPDFISLEAWCINENSILFFKEDKTLLYGLGRDRVGNLIVSKPRQAKYVVFQNQNIYNKLDYTPYFRVYKPSILNRVIRVEEEIFTSQKYKVGLDGFIEPLYSVGHASVSDYRLLLSHKLYINGYADGLRVITFYDKNKRYIPFSEINTGNISKRITVPDNAVYYIAQATNSHKSRFFIDFYQDENGILPNEIKDIDISDNAVMVNDGFTQTSASAVEIAYDKTIGLVYATYLSSYKVYGEARQKICLTIYPLIAPHQAKTYEVVKNGGVYNGLAINNPYEPNILLLPSGKVRILFYDDAKTNYYRDFDLKTEVFDDIKNIKFNDGSEIVNLTASVYANYLTANGYAHSHAPLLKHGAILTSQFVEYNGSLYSVLSTYDDRPIIVKSNDYFETIEPVSIYPFNAHYEADLVFLNNRIHFIRRYAPSIFYNTSDDMGVTWNGEYILNYSTETRPCIDVYKGKVLISYNTKTSIGGDFAGVIWRRRERIQIIWGDSDNPNDWDVVFSSASRYGIVYYRLLNIVDEIYFAFSNGKMAFEEMNGVYHGGYYVQGKDSVLWTKLGDLVPTSIT